LLAAECNIPIIPVWIKGNGGLDVRPRRKRKAVKLAFGTPIPSNPRRTSEELAGLLEASWHGMRQAAGKGG
jgi:hypothetical protein